tara:strand:- start:5085 stop:5552 length:468 start_codon:yes stop_codon:yes gene_type:complete
MNNSKALLGAGCFWGVEEFFRKMPGILNTKVGYAGGNFNNPSYEEVCSDKTGHAEVVEIEFDQKIISYEKILDVFWECHDPTQLNRQGFDYGSQYRSIILYYTDEQKCIAEKSKNNFQKKISKKIVTEIVKEVKFYLAEEYHQCYIKKNHIKTID